MPVAEALDDIQGIIIGGYGKLKGARFVLLTITSPPTAATWLNTLEVRNAEHAPESADTCINVALTAGGLEKLGLPAQVLASFDARFVDGMASTPQRNRILGDLGDSAPESWQWGGPANPAIDLMLLLYATDEAAVAQLCENIEESMTGVSVVRTLHGTTLAGNREHFGFADGISNPVIQSLAGAATPTFNVIADGEFVLGYPNAYGQMTNRPFVADTPAAADLPEAGAPGSSAPIGANDRDLGRNGSYLVFRQLSQDVAGFWQYLDQQSHGDGAARRHLAAKMVGRWPGGAPLTTHPETDDPARARENDFLYVGSGDRHGFGCPIGAHIRRSNPRDALDPNPGSAESIDVGKRHRIMRRGRPYGPPASPSLDPDDLFAAGADDVDRGLHFLCFNTHIGRQFEFVQHTWANNPKFDGLYADDDPLIGDRGVGSTPGGQFTVQAEPVRRKVAAMPRFVQVRGGAYFFIPGLRSLRYLMGLSASGNHS